MDILKQKVKDLKFLKKSTYISSKYPSKIKNN